MLISPRLTVRHRLVAIAAVAVAAISVGPVSSAGAVDRHQISAEYVAASAKTKIVPNVVGKTAYVAKKALQKVGLGYRYSTPKGSFVILSGDWTVTKQSPKAKSKVKAGTKIKLTVVKTSTLSAAPSAPVAPPVPAMTASQAQAVISAKGYLSDGQGFSYQGLINQLDSPDGDGFSAADATFAVNSLNVDFNAQAVLAAKGYISDGQGFSHNGLVEQLSSPDGDSFTLAQAEYATAQVGL
jgi:PASTA domain/Host cell surface-exposed lipoprotein